MMYDGERRDERGEIQIAEIDKRAMKIENQIFDQKGDARKYFKGEKPNIVRGMHFMGMG